MASNSFATTTLNFESDSDEGSSMRTPTKRVGDPMESPSKKAVSAEEGSSVRTPTKRDDFKHSSGFMTPVVIDNLDNTPPPSPNGMEEEKHRASTKGIVVSEHSGSFSPVTVLRNQNGCKIVEKQFYVAGKGVKPKTMSGLKTKCPEYTVMFWNDWLRNKCAHMEYSGPASKHFVKTYDITTIKDGGDDGLSIFEMEMEYVLPVLEFLSSYPDKRNKLSCLYFRTLHDINKALLENGFVLEDVHPQNCGLRFLQDGTFELVFFDLQFSTVEKGINIPSEYVFEMTTDLTANERKVLKKRQALLLMVESINRYDPARPRKEHLQEIAHELNIGCMSLEQVDLALGAFL